jgi:hypothetical protein
MLHMEADWDIEIGDGAPVIDVDWAGRIDLRGNPDRIFDLEEVRGFPALATVLLRLNSAGSGLSTSKCDVWDVDQFDCDELDAPGDPGVARACYIDLVPDQNLECATPEQAVAWCRQVCGRLRVSKLRCCRVDLVVRRAVRTPIQPSADATVAITAYTTACGRTPAEAAETLAVAVTALVEGVFAEGTPEETRQKLQ